MSDIVEKTLASFPKFLSEGLLGGNQTRSPKHDIPPGLRQLIAATLSARSKSDEELIIQKELSFLQQRFSQLNQSGQQLKENLSRLLYCLTLGYDVSFATIHTIKLAQQGVGIHKRLGYLMSCLLLHEDHEMLVLLINTIQKDMRSSSLLDNCMSITAASQLLHAETIPMFLPLVMEKLKHQRELVRVKAAQCLHQFYLKAPNMLVHVHADFQRALCDKDPGVIRGVVHIYIQLAQKAPADYVHLGVGFLGILKQIISRSFPSLHDFHTVPLPWLQILLLKVLALLGPHDEKLRIEMWPVLRDIIQRTTVKHHMAFAVMYECILTVSCVPGDPELMNEASTCVARFLRSSSNTLKYLGIKALTALIGVSPEYAVQHQLTVVQCLDGDELATQRKTLHLLYKMANEANVKAICSKLFEHLKMTDDPFCKTDMAGKIAQLAEKWSPDIQWYVETVNAVLVECTNSALVDQLMDKLDMELHLKENKEFEEFLVQSYLPCLENAECPTALLHLAVWVLGEMRMGLGTQKPSRVLAALCSPLPRAADAHLHGLVFSSLINLVVKGVVDAGAVRDWFGFNKYTFTQPQLQQKFQEVQVLVAQPEKSRKICISQNGGRVKKLDFTLSFLDDYVCASLESNDASPYKPLGVRMTTSRPTEDATSDSEEGYSALYHGIVSPAKYDSPRSSQREDSFTSNLSEGSEKTGETGLKMSGVRRVWGKEGYLGADHARSARPQPGEQGVQAGNNQDGERHQEIASALFQGVSGSVERRPTSDDGESGGSPGWLAAQTDSGDLPTTDSSGWRAYSATQHQASSRDDALGDSGTDTSRGQDLSMTHSPSQPGVSDVRAPTTNQDEAALTSSQSERREIWLANEGSPQHVQYESLYSGQTDAASGEVTHSSMYDEFTEQDKDVLGDITESFTPETLVQNSLYSSYYTPDS
ncbi:AP-4 complex subunit epsilon-1-like isoform X1 [Haliotis rufescens]|uniref:AP-4 complex subunit epsilon-1-like isoform X1 n=1 Tax=Haliotis rufescens TaxID=6454 RepID=UPI00201EB339|nr:AP-4 complex subunit epsilon-1-like isoform X1 [Haliotis rufescens]